MVVVCGKADDEPNRKGGCVFTMKTLPEVNKYKDKIIDWEINLEETI